MNRLIDSCRKTTEIWPKIEICSLLATTVMLVDDVISWYPNRTSGKQKGRELIAEVV